MVQWVWSTSLTVITRVFHVRKFDVNICQIPEGNQLSSILPEAETEHHQQSKLEEAVQCFENGHYLEQRVKKWKGEEEG